MTEELKLGQIRAEFFDQVEPSIEQAFFQLTDNSSFAIPETPNILPKPNSCEIKPLPSITGLIDKPQQNLGIRFNGFKSGISFVFPGKNWAESD